MFPVLKSIQSIVKARLTGLIVAGAFLSLLTVILLIVLVSFITSNLTGFETEWVNSLINWSAGIATGVIGWFLLPAFMAFFAGMFQERVIFKVESVYYPDSKRGEAPKFWPDILHDIRFTLKALLLNILILPLYLFGIGFIISILLNSYLLGREFFESAAGYHLGKPAARELGRKHRFIVYGGGAMIVVVTLIPIVNFIMPVLATVWMVHIYHAIQNGAQETIS